MSSYLGSGFFYKNYPRPLIEKAVDVGKPVEPWFDGKGDRLQNGFNPSSFQLFLLSLDVTWQ